MLTRGLPGTTRTLILTLVALATVASTGPALGQSDRDLREENRRLQTRVNDLQRELDAARTRIAEMERELQVLMRRLGQTAGPPTTAPAPEERVTIDESVPNASPRALFRAISDSYAEAMSEYEVGDYETTAGSRNRTAYLRAVKSWAKRIQREMKSSVVWHVELLPMAEQGGEEPGLRVRAVDPETRVVLGPPFTIRLGSAVMRKLAALEQRGSIDELVLKGVLVPEVRINPDRIDAGPFDNPRLIGPFAEFDFVVTASSLTLPEKDE